MKKGLDRNLFIFIYFISKGLYLGNGDDLSLYKYMEWEYGNKTIDYLNDLKKSGLVKEYSASIMISMQSNMLSLSDKKLEDFLIFNKEKELYTIEFDYIIDTGKIKKYISDILKKWKDLNILPPTYSNYYKVDKQIGKVIDIIHDFKKEYLNDVMTINTSEYQDYDIIMTIIFLDNKKIINIGTVLFEENNINLSIKLTNNSGLINYYNSYSLINGNRILFNKNNGTISLNGDLLGEISINTQPYKFFKYLYENKGNFKTHNEIHEYIYGKGVKTEKPIYSNMADIKSELQKDIKGLVKSKNGGYIIP